MKRIKAHDTYYLREPDDKAAWCVMYWPCAFKKRIVLTHIVIFLKVILHFKKNMSYTDKIQWTEGHVSLLDVQSVSDFVQRAILLIQHFL